AACAASGCRPWHLPRNTADTAGSAQSLGGGFGHFLAQAQRAHVGPDLVDVGQAVLLQAALAHGTPAIGDGLVVGPDRVLLFVVDHYLELDIVAVENGSHCLSP